MRAYTPRQSPNRMEEEEDSTILHLLQRQVDNKPIVMEEEEDSTILHLLQRQVDNIPIVMEEWTVQSSTYSSTR
jgi:hypothetical protein